jgi:hypothetical protein
MLVAHMTQRCVVRAVLRIARLGVLTFFAQRTSQIRGDCPKTVLNAIDVTYVRNVLSVIQAKIWPKKHYIRPKRGNRLKR